MGPVSALWRLGACRRDGHPVRGTAGAAETAGAATITRHVVVQDRAADQWSPKPGYNSTDKAMARIRCRWFAQTCRTSGSHVSRPPRTAKAGRPCDRIDGG